MKKFWKDHSATIIAGAVWIVMSVIAYILGLALFSGEQAHAGEEATLAAYQQWYWFQWTMSMLADAFGTFFIIVLLIKWQDRESKAG